jgi:hypothetical protein
MVPYKVGQALRSAQGLPRFIGYPTSGRSARRVRTAHHRSCSYPTSGGTSLA